MSSLSRHNPAMRSAGAQELPVSWMRTRPAQQAIADVQQLFERHFGMPPAGVWSAPGRVNLIGEHVDYAAGISVPFALSQRTWVAARLNGLGSYRVVSAYARSPEAPVSDISVEVATTEVGPGHPADWSGYSVGAIWAATEAGVIPRLPAGEDGMDIAIVSDVPVGAGLSSSAALECSSALAAWELMSTRPELSDEVRTGLMVASIRAENDVVGASTGGLDQRISLFGRHGHALAIDFSADTATHVPFDIEPAGLAVLIINTNAPHRLADGQYAARRAVIDGVTADLGVSSLRFAGNAVEDSRRWAQANVPENIAADQWVRTVGKRVRHVVSEVERTAASIEDLQRGDYEAFGRAMVASHASLRDDYEVTVPELDVAVDVALSQGALGARMTGGGFGGSVIALVKRDSIDSVAEAVTRAFAKAGFNRPECAVALPSDGARRDV